MLLQSFSLHRSFDLHITITSLNSLSLWKRVSSLELLYRGLVTNFLSIYLKYYVEKS